MAISPGILTKVTDGWTGTITVTRGSTVATITPRPRTSPLKVVERLVYEVRRVHGVEFFIYVNSFSRFIAVMPGNLFDMAATGTTAAKTGLTANSSSVYSVVFPTAIPSSILPAYGIRVRTALVGMSRGKSLLSGGLGFNNGRAKIQGSLALFDTLANSSTFSDTLSAGGVYDFSVLRTNDATNVTTVERIMIKATGVARWSALGSSGRVLCSVQGVSE
tara:strand:+ start:6450 stop:7106 length:657 start_codon:yes stop_codon:yes gene_type:complete